MRERRLHLRETITLSCYLEMASGATFNGYTEDIGMGGVFMRSHEFAAKPDRAPRMGDTGLLILHYTKGYIKRGLRLRCRIAHAQLSGIGIDTYPSDLTEEQADTLEQIILTAGNLP